MAKTDKIADLLHEAAETHHKVYRITNGDDPDWATWYAEWLLNFSELPQILNTRPIRSHLIYWLVQSDFNFVSQNMKGSWEDYYAENIVKEFRAGAGSSPSPSPSPAPKPKKK